MSPRARALIQQVARDHGLTVDDLMGRSQERRVAFPRFVAMHKLRQLEDDDGDPVFSYPQIGRMFGRDHTTVIDAVRRADELQLATGAQIPLPL